MIRISIYTAPTENDCRGGAISTRVVSENDVSEVLREIGLEWKTADYMSQRQVVLTLDPVRENEVREIKTAVRAAAQALEDTGLL